MERAAGYDVTRRASSPATVMADIIGKPIGISILVWNFVTPSGLLPLDLVQYNRWPIPPCEILNS